MPRDSAVAFAASTSMCTWFRWMLTWTMRNAASVSKFSSRNAAVIVRRFTWLSYAAATWSRERDVVLKVEPSERGENPRFVVTTLAGFDAGLIYDRAFCPRGQSENFIKDFKNALAADRLSCHRFVANAFRLFLHAVVYRLMHALRTTAAVVAPALGRLQMDTLRLRLLKVAALVVRSVRRILVRLPQVFPLADAFGAIARRLGAT